MRYMFAMFALDHVDGNLVNLVGKVYISDSLRKIH